jgi:transcriptional regulator with XRE-family HTH domain
LIGKKLKSYRNANKLSQRKLGEISGVSFVYIQKLERNENKNPSMNILEKLSTALSINVFDFMDDTPPDGISIRNNTLGDKIKQAREDIGISQRELGRRIGKTGQYISYIESNEDSNPSLDVLKIIAIVLDLSVSELVEDAPIVNSCIGDRLRELRIRKELTQKQLAEKIDLTAPTITKYENGLLEPNITTLNKLANYYDVTVDYLTCNSNEITYRKATIAEVCTAMKECTKKYAKAMEILANS